MADIDIDTNSPEVNREKSKEILHNLKSLCAYYLRCLSKDVAI